MKNVIGIACIAWLAFFLNSCSKNDEPFMSARINGQDWVATSTSVEKNSLFEVFDLIGSSGSDEITIIDIELFTTSIGDYVIDSPYTAYASLTMINQTTSQYDTYFPIDKNGTVTITQNKKGLISGTFAFAAVENGDTVMITDGVFSNFSLK